MRGLIYRDVGDVRCESIPDPEPTDVDAAIVRIESAAICGSDLHTYHGQIGPGPFSLGHEAIGEVVEKGSGVRRFKAGDRVLVSGIAGCRTCAPCGRGAVTLCEGGAGQVFGTNQGLAGSQAEALLVPSADVTLAAIPEGVSAKSAVLLTDILPTGYWGAENAEIEPGHDVAVIGCGPVGLMAIQSAMLFGPRRVFALDGVPERLEAARRLGAIPCDVSADANAAVLEATGGLGPHSVIEAVGADAAIQNAIGLVRRGGRVSVVGVNMNMDFRFPMAVALVKSVTFRIGVCPVPRLWPHLVPLVAEGKLEPDFVFTHEMGLSEGAEAYRLFDSRADGVLKVLLNPND
ncbi:MAG: alcohol dehydrogenase catalytic domain-containing protein [Myxococcota bacterium]